MQAVLAICADRVIRDAESEQISAIALFEGIRVQLPSLLARLSCLFILARTQEEPNQFDARFRLTLGGSQIIDQQIHVDFQDKYRTRVIVTLLGVPLPNSGVLRAELLLDGSLLSTYEFPVEQGAPPAVNVRTV